MSNPKIKQMGKTRIVLVPETVDMNQIKNEEGFNPSPFSWEPVTAGEFLPSETRIGFVRVETPARTCMMSLGQLKKSGLPTSFEEEKWEVAFSRKTGYVGRPKS